MVPLTCPKSPETGSFTMEDWFTVARCAGDALLFLTGVLALADTLIRRRL